MRIRLADENDLVAITAIYNQAVANGYSTGDTEPVPIQYMQLWFKQHSPDDTPVFVAEQDDETVTGYAYFSDYRYGRPAFRRTLEISYYVDEDHRQRGIAGALMDYAMEFAREKQVWNLVAFLLAPNEASIAFLRKHGFEQWGELPGVAELRDGVYDHVIYGRKIE